MDWTLIVTSAGVAALVSSGMALAGQHFERKSRREELALSKALEMGKFLSQAGIETNHESWDPVISAGKYYKWIVHLLDEGKLPQEAINIHNTSNPLKKF